MNGIKPLGLICALLIVFPSVSAASIAPGDLIISEVMANPNIITDANGEWFEIHNMTGNVMDLSGLTLSDDGSNNHIIDNGGPLMINPYDYMVFGRNGDMDTNGGYTADYVYSGFYLDNGSDEIVISNNGIEIIRLIYTDGFVVAGKSQELFGAITIPLTNADFVSSVSSYGLGNLGTPGSKGDSTWAVQATPIPGAIWLLGSAFIGLLGMGRRDRQKN